MKTVLKLLLVFVINNLLAQEPSFPVANASWVTNHISPCLGGTTIKYAWTEYLYGDTLIEEKTYVKLILDKHCVYANAGSHCPESYIYPKNGDFAMGGILEENGRVIFKKFDVPDSLFEAYERELKNVPPGEEIVIYDLNWEVGDSIAYPLENTDDLLFDITSIELQNGLKKFHLQLRDAQPWMQFETIEGMGGMMGLFNMYYPDLLDGEYLTVPVCFYLEGILIQEGEYCTNLCEVTATHESNVILPSKVYPNPVDDQLIVQSYEPGHPIVRIVDVYGRVIKQQSMNSHFETLDTHDWRSGIYFVMIEINGKHTVHNVLKQ